MWEESKYDPLTELYLEHLSTYYRMKIWKIFLKYKSLSDVPLGEVVTTENVIDLTVGAKPANSFLIIPDPARARS